MSMELPNNREITYFAETNYRDTRKVFGIKRRDRRQHMYILGKSGTGKSVLISNLAYQDIKHGHGLAIVDPHGDLVEEILSSIPPERLGDVVYFNPSDPDYHIGFNVLEVKNDKQKHLIASGIMGIFTKIWANAWSSRMEYILNNSILALLDTPGTTLLGIPRLLVDKDYRQGIIKNIKDPVVRTFWVHEYESWQERYRSEAIAPIQNKVGQFLSTALVRNIVGQQKSTIDVSEIMDKGKIFLINLSKGRIGEDNSALLGGMMITKLQLAAMERVDILEDDRKDFYLYVDEFQNFVTESFASILSEARKYRLNLIVAHQYIAQLSEQDSTIVRDAVFGNVGTMIVFRVGAADADFIETEFMPEFTPEDFVSLPNYHIYLKLLVDGMTTRPFSSVTLAPIVKFQRDPAKEFIIVQKSRELYHRPRAEVEEEISNWSMDSGSKTSRLSPNSDSPKREFAPTVLVENTEIAPKTPSGPSLPSHIDTSDLAALGIEFSGPSAEIPPKNNLKDHGFKPGSTGFSERNIKTGLKYANPKPVAGFNMPLLRNDAPKEKIIANEEVKINLKKLLGEALKEAGDGAKPQGFQKQDFISVKPDQPKMSLATLQSEVEVADKFKTYTKKEASSESSSALRDALAKAMKQADPKITSDVVSVSENLNKKTELPPPAPLVEVPEDVLKKLLS